MKKNTLYSHLGGVMASLRSACHHPRWSGFSCRSLAKRGSGTFRSLILNKYTLLTLLYTFILTAFSFQFTHSFFTSSAQSTNNTFTASSEFPATPTPTPIGYGIVINEVFQSADNKDEWVELYNSTNAPIDVSGWKISDKNAYDNGNDDTFPSVSPVPENGYAVITTSKGIAGIPLSAIIITLKNAKIGSGLDTTGDSVVLKNSATNIIDAMSYGTDHTFFTSPPHAPAAGKTLSRFPNGLDTNTASDWISTSSASLGTSNN